MFIFSYKFNLKIKYTNIKMQKVFYPGYLNPSYV